MDPIIKNAESVETESQMTEEINYTTKLIACGFYTRGLWSPFIAWIRLAGCPFRFEAIEWKIDREILRKELRRAFLFAWGWTILEAFIFYSFVHNESSWLGATFVWLVFLQWIVYPYFAARDVFRRLDGQKVNKTKSINKNLISKETESSICDLGYLLREANFSIDSTKKIDSWEQSEASSAPLTPTAEMFYNEIENAFPGNSNGISTQRLTVVAAKNFQPKFRDWRFWSVPKTSLISDSQKTELQRLLIFGEPSQMDGLAIVEFTARVIDPHVSFRLRMRWLPGLKERFRVLDFLRKEKIWWRGLFAPLALAAITILLWLIGSVLAYSIQQDSTPGGISLHALLNAKTQFSGWPAFSLDEYSDTLNQLPQSMLLFLFSNGGIGFFAWLFFVVAFHVPLFFLIVLLGRFARWLRGLLYSGTGMYLFTGSKNCLRFQLTDSGLKDEESLQVSVSYLQIIEQVLTNRVIDTLRHFGINTDSIRDEFKMFINEGIYMTGGQFRASNVLVGRRGILNAKRQRMARSVALIAPEVLGTAKAIAGFFA